MSDPFQHVSLSLEMDKEMDMAGALNLTNLLNYIRKEISRSIIYSIIYVKITPNFTILKALG